MIDDSGKNGWTVLDAAILVYLALPNVLFAAGWLRPEIGGPLAVLVIAGLRRFLSTARPPIPPAAAALAVAAAAGWAALGGAGHLGFANFDWEVRDAVMFDLAARPWPVVYDGLLLLRSTIAYFLPAALAAKLAGVAWADTLLLLWTILGTALVLLAVAAHTRTPGRTAAGVAVFVLFSGADVVGSVLAGRPLSATQHMEWWAGALQYSSHTTQLFWVPNHALAAWLATVLLWRHWGREELLPVVGLLLALLPLWSPLSAVGVIPLAAAAVWGCWREGRWRRGLSVANLAAAPAMGAAAAAYVTVAAGTVGAPAALQDGPPALVVLLFLLVEAVPLVIGLRLAQGRLPMPQRVAAACLLLLPLVSLGPSNDLPMRVSIAPLALLALGAVAVAARPPRPPARALPLALVLLLGAATPAAEITRAVALPRWPPAGAGLSEVLQGTWAAHYLADPRGSWFAPLMAKPPRKG